MRGDSKIDWSDAAKGRGVQGHVSKPHHRRPPNRAAGSQLSSIHERADARTEWANGFDGVDTADLRKCPCQKFPDGFNRHDRLFDHGRLLWYGAICDAAEDRASARKRSELTGPITFDSGRDE